MFETIVYESTLTKNTNIKSKRRIKNSFLLIWLILTSSATISSLLNKNPPTVLYVNKPRHVHILDYWIAPIGSRWKCINVCRQYSGCGNKVVASVAARRCTQLHYGCTMDGVCFIFSPCFYVESLVICGISLDEFHESSWGNDNNWHVWLFYRLEVLFNLMWLSLFWVNFSIN